MKSNIVFYFLIKRKDLSENAVSQSCHFEPHFSPGKVVMRQQLLITQLVTQLSKMESDIRVEISSIVMRSNFVLLS